jgi:predicted permease
MARLRRLFARFRSLLRNSRAEHELEREVASHLALLAEGFEHRGMSPEDARLAAKRCYGGVEQAKQAHRDERSFLWLEQMLQDLRYALRMLRRSPGFAAVVIITLALGIGANTAIFTEIDAVLLRSLPAADPQHLVILEWSAQNKAKIESRSSYGDCTQDCSFSVPFFGALRSSSRTLSNLAAFAGPIEVNFSGNGPANMTRGLFVSGDYFQTVGQSVFLGRTLGPADDSQSAPPTIVLDYGYWQRAFGGDVSVVGRVVRLNNVDATVVGIASLGFKSLTPGKHQDFFMPLSLAKRVQSEWWDNDNRLADPGTWWVLIEGRLKPDNSMAQAQAEVTTLFRTETMHGAKPVFKEADAPRIRVLPAREALDGESSQIAPMLTLIMIAVGLILMVACANVAGLILARSTRRQKELAVRQALGAGRSRIVRQLLAESLLLSFAGGSLGVLFAVWGVEAITKFVSNGTNDPFAYTVTPDWRVLSFVTALTLSTGMLCGLAPALRGLRADLTPSLRENASSISGGASRSKKHLRLGDALVVAQVALSIVVLVGAGLLVRTLQKLQSIDPGFDTQNILLFGINPNLAGYGDQQTSQLYRQLQERFAALPGVVSASYSESALLSRSWSSTDIHLDGAPPKSNVETQQLSVGADFFTMMRIPMLAGRSFTAQDFADAERVREARASAKANVAASASSAPITMQLSPVPVVVNHAFVAKFFPNRDPLGRHFGNSQGDEPVKTPQPGYRVIGVVGDTRYESPQSEIQPTMFKPLVSNSAHFELRTSGDPIALIKQVRGTVAATDINLPLFDVRTQRQQIEQTLFKERLMSRLSSFFAILALVLACIGLYGLLSYEVARRTRELGIRMALGAQRTNLMRLVVRQGLMLALIGVFIGIGASMAATRLMASMLYGVRPNDPITFAAVSMLMLLVAFAACTIPARRAMRVDPMVALREE